MKIRMLVAYDGTGYCGWQRQSDTKLPSLQQTLEAGISKYFSQDISVSASGRTDAGVHALGQVCHFTVVDPPERLLNRDFCWAMKGILPPEISVRKAWIAPHEFHSTLSAVNKTYRYFIYNHPRSNPFHRHYSAWIRNPVDLDHLQKTAPLILGRHDFKAFQSAGTEVSSTVRTIYEAKWERRSQNMLRLTITGQGFLKQMVRNLVGTQLKLAKECRDPIEMTRILESLDRRQAAAPAPAQGLFLWKVRYPPDLDKQCRPL